MKNSHRNCIMIIMSLTLLHTSCTQAIKPIDLPSERSKNHTDIPLYAFSIILPDSGFVNQEGSNNFINPKLNSSMDISDLGIGVDSAISMLLQPDNGQIKIDLERDISNSFMHGKILKLFPVDEFHSEYEDSTIVWFLVLGDELITYAITIKYPKQFEHALSEKVLSSLSSLYYDENKIIDPFEIMPFTMNMNETSLKYIGLNYGQPYFNLNGKSFAESIDDAVLVISKMEISDS